MVQEHFSLQKSHQEKKKGMKPVKVFFSQAVMSALLVDMCCLKCLRTEPGLDVQMMRTHKTSKVCIQSPLQTSGFIASQRQYVFLRTLLLVCAI